VSFAVVGGAGILACSHGTAPTPFVVLPTRKVMVSSMLMGNISDIAPMANITPFAMCTSLANPTVAAATAAANGVLTPMPCVPVTTAPWISGATTVLVQGVPALDKSAMLMCTWAGMITVKQPGNTIVKVP